VKEKSLEINQKLHLLAEGAFVEIPLRNCSGLLVAGLYQCRRRGRGRSGRGPGALLCCDMFGLSLYCHILLSVGLFEGKRVCKESKNIEDLKENIRTEIRRIDTAELRRVYDNMLQRAQKCIDVQDHFQHLL
jgi:hypothetical protein